MVEVLHASPAAPFGDTCAICPLPAASEADNRLLWACSAALQTARMHPSGASTGGYGGHRSRAFLRETGAMLLHLCMGTSMPP